MRSAHLPVVAEYGFHARAALQLVDESGRFLQGCAAGAAVEPSVDRDSPPLAPSAPGRVCPFGQEQRGLPALR